MISTGFSWVGCEGTKIGRQRMIVAFSNDGERQKFMSTVKIPKGMDVSFGSFESL